MKIPIKFEIIFCDEKIVSKKIKFIKLNIGVNNENN